MYHRIKGLILREKTSAEADKLITLYTREWGKISAVVPGAKKIKAKLSAATEPVVETDLMVYVRSQHSRPKVTGAQIMAHYPALRKEWRRFVAAQSCAEITDVLTPYYDENAQKYELLARTWKHLEQARYPWRILMAFTLRFLKLSGYSFTEYLDRETTSLSARERQLIRQLATLSGERVDRELEIDEDTEKDITRYMENYLNLYLPRPLATKKFWKQIETI